MPKEVFHIRQFHGGINDASAATDISDIECQAADDCKLSSVGRILLTGSLDNNPSPDPTDKASITQPGRGLFAFSHDRDSTGDLSTVDYYAIHDLNEVYVWDTNDTTWVNIVTTANWTLGTDNDAIYLFNDGVLRISDAQLSASNPRWWWGYVNRTQFPSPGPNRSIAEMVTEAADLAAPTDGEFSTSATFPTSAGTDVNIKYTAGGTSGSIPNATYKVGVTFVYDDVQESLLKEVSDEIDLTTDNEILSIEVYLLGNYSKRMSGARVYVQEKEAADTDWILLIDIDFNKGYRFSLSETYRVLWSTGSGQEAKLAPASGNKITRLGAETYQSINGYAHDEPIDCSYKTSTVVDGITYAGYILQDGKTYPDRIIKCAIHSQGIASDAFPELNFVDITPNDGDYIVNLESFADRVLVFKRNSLFVVNYSEGVGDYLENTYPNMGIERTSHAFPTAHGIVFMNKLGVHMFDGETVRTLTGKMLDTSLPERVASPTYSGSGPVAPPPTQSSGGGGMM